MYVLCEKSPYHATNNQVTSKHNEKIVDFQKTINSWVHGKPKRCRKRKVAKGPLIWLK